jgi:hypothetical protein
MYIDGTWKSSIQKGVVQGQNAFLLMIGQLYWKLLP